MEFNIVVLINISAIFNISRRFRVTFKTVPKCKSTLLMNITLDTNILGSRYNFVDFITVLGVLPTFGVAIFGCFQVDGVYLAEEFLFEIIKGGIFMLLMFFHECECRFGFEILGLFTCDGKIWIIFLKFRAFFFGKRSTTSWGCLCSFLSQISPLSSS